ncbi:acetyl/propionyl/methylcrotonyl-CoA carboxylase subunit alpha [Pseudonocardia endophytica]|uniref:Acetyl-CoA/propionyl-CoA carboxylase biotin carboxyl carrier protein n=1 Tax=Pseudonocardia endophytica TaxID=401976 RepID=A0A4R1HRK2_PSEEN|nr:biotin carboxylase N-terminal domain-containing protein [Pseudonocardia endophytica]TCK22429.1 acetyl-CoA/propionyl-CoA carboxylase biotin carboxyl carrier protein [Pseudonocardia endophytica]
MVRSVLIANRGEIAVRIVRACRDQGVRTIAVYSDADADALHVRLADEAHRIGPAPARESYLSVDAVLCAAAASGADAVHPGYGLLSENAAFAAAVVDAGLTWIGPAPDVIARMGDKVAALETARAAQVPVLPGSDGTVEAGPRAARMASEIGFPLVVKAAFGGGGRGMRVVRSPEDLDAALIAAAREASAAFGRGDVYVERYLDRPRHVEVQILADAHGTVLHLGDRDCSVQRRHQKLIEEAPADLPSDVRSGLHAAAVRLAREVGYVGAGTVEFLVDGAQFFFLEMNTRLQVEHGVTELVTGVDLVAAQLGVAAGDKLWFAQDDVTVDGHAIQARIAAEDPYAGFRPSPGTVRGLHLPLGPWVRCDLGVEAGDAVAPEYDSMFGKILARGPDRDSARRRLGAALDELLVDGVPTTAPYLRTVLDEETFVDGTHDTGSVERDWVPTTPPEARPAPAPASGRPEAGPRTRRVRIATDRGPVEIAIPSRADRSERIQQGSSGVGGATSGAAPTAPMDATVVDVPVAAGAAVSAGDVLVVLEAMKMEIEVRAPVDGTLTAVHVSSGASVAAGTVLADVTPA